MKRDIKKLTNWKGFEKNLLKDKIFAQVANTLEPEFVLADSLITARKKSNLTQVELANLIGTKQPVISNLETASAKPSLTLLKKLARALDSKLVVRFE